MANPDSSKHCPSCGAQLAKSDVDECTCPKCGADLSSLPECEEALADEEQNLMEGGFFIFGEPWE